MTTLTFRNTVLAATVRQNQIWLTSAELSKALQYASNRAVTKIFNQNGDEFTDCMTKIIEVPNLGTSGNLVTKQRIFSLRGAHLIAMFSRTAVAKEFRKWVLDILDRESGIQSIEDYISDSEIQELIRATNACAMRTGEYSDLILQRLCEHFNISNRKELKTSQLNEAHEFLQSVSKKDIVGKRYFVEVKITDYMFHGEKTLYGRCNDFNALLTCLALELGYKIQSISKHQQTLNF